MQRREDIQWLRCLAILAVLAFHLWPRLFPMGFLGVDVFFVISGYLMTVVLSRQSTKDSFFTSVLTFYSRRVRRIFPSYFFTIFATLAVGRWLLISIDFDFLKTDGLFAVSFLANLQPLLQRDSYWRLTGDYRFLVHAWSLAVEIQYYLVAPFVVGFLTMTRFSGLLTSTLILLSALGQCLVPAELGFGCVAFRLWQFLTGTLAFLSAKERHLRHALYKPMPEEEMTHGFSVDPFDAAPKNLRQSSAFTFALATLIVLCFSTVKLSVPQFDQACRVLATALTGWLIWVEQDVSVVTDGGWGSVFSLVGDTSYAIYLVHWPVLTLARYFGYDSGNPIYASGTVLIIFVLSILQYNFLEKTLPSKPQSAAFCTAVCLLLVSVGMAVVPLSVSPYSWAPLTHNLSLAEALRMNAQMATQCAWIPIACERDALLDTHFPGNQEFDHADNHYQLRCTFPLTGSGNKTFLVIGNSFAARMVDMVIQAITESELASRYSRGYVIAWAACPSFPFTFDYMSPERKCHEKGNLTGFIQQLQPDLLIMVNRLDFISQFNEPMNETGRDELVEGLRVDFDQLTSHSKSVIVVEPNPLVWNDSLSGYTAADLAHTLIQRKSVPQLFENRTLLESHLTPSWQRMQEVVYPCRRCHIFTTTRHFCNQTACALVDSTNSLSFYCDSSHLSAHGSRKLLKPFIGFLNKVVH